MKPALLSIMCISFASVSLGGSSGSDKNADLLQAARSGDLKGVQTALSGGADINAMDDVFGWTPLMVAAIHHHADVVRFLLEKGAEVNRKDKYGDTTALWSAAVSGDPEIVKLLLEKGAEVNVENSVSGWTPLMSAAQSGHLEVVRLLLEKGADVNAKTYEDKTTASEIARRAGHEEIAQLLDKASAREPPAGSSTTNSRSSAERDVAGVVNGQMVFMYFPLNTLEDGQWKVTGVLPLEGSYLKSGQSNQTPIRSVTVITMKPALEALYKKYGIAQPFLPKAVVEKAGEVILHSADITPSEDYAYVAAIMDDTKANVIALTEDGNIQLGEGTSLSLMLVESSGRIISKSLLGYPGSEITLQPHTSVTWNGMNLHPGNEQPVCFKLGLVDGTPQVSKIISGELGFSWKDSQGATITGVFPQNLVGASEEELNQAKLNHEHCLTSFEKGDISREELDEAAKALKDAEEKLQKAREAASRIPGMALTGSNMSGNNARSPSAGADAAMAERAKTKELKGSDQVGQQKGTTLTEFKPTLSGHRNKAFVKTDTVPSLWYRATVFFIGNEPNEALAGARGGIVWGGGYRVGLDCHEYQPGTHVAIDPNTEYTGNFDYDGSEYTFLGKVALLRHVFSSDPNSPLVFKLVKDEGFVHVSGKGTVTTKEGEKLVF